jgi:hypothetical protein
MVTATDYISIPYNVNNRVNVSWGAWVKIISYVGDMTVMGNDNGAFDRSFFTQTAENKWTICAGTGAYWKPTSLTLPATNTWTHVFVVYSTANIEFYVNGTRYSRGSAQGAIGAGSTTMKIGRNDNAGGAGYWCGYIDDARLYDRALTGAEVVSIYNNGNGTEAE